MLGIVRNSLLPGQHSSHMRRSSEHALSAMTQCQLMGRDSKDGKGTETGDEWMWTMRSGLERGREVLVVKVECTE